MTSSPYKSFAFPLINKKYEPTSFWEMRQSDKRDYAIIVEGESKIQTTLRLSPTLNTRIQRVIIAYKSAASNSKPPLEAPTQTWVYEQIRVKGLPTLERELGVSA